MVTIGMPVFNDIDFIEKSLQSILNQEFTDFRLLISDDGSSDGSDRICMRYAKKDDRITYIRQPENLGISKNMKFLLTEAKTPYFMWAGDDDLWDPSFLKTCLSLLERNPDAIVAFTRFLTIDEDGIEQKNISTPNYCQKTPHKRLKEFSRNSIDTFGYGLFRTNLIREVSFPTWWWPNRNTPYNNIYPTLCFYLSKGNYVEHSDSPLFFKRIKTKAKTNHQLTGEGNGLSETFAYVIRRFNLITFSTREIRKAGSISLAIRIYPSLFYHWFIKSVGHQLGLILKSLFRKTRRKSKLDTTDRSE